MMENSIYAILSPEGFASILWKDASRSAEACDMMKLTAPDLMRLGVIDDIIPEPGGRRAYRPGSGDPPGGPLPARHPGRPCKGKRPRLMAAARYQKFRKMGSGRSPEGGAMNGIKIRGHRPAVFRSTLSPMTTWPKIVETNDEWITTRTGIQHRHHCTTESHTFLCVNAAKSALEKAGVTPR